MPNAAADPRRLLAATFPRTHHPEELLPIQFGGRSKGGFCPSRPGPDELRSPTIDAERGVGRIRAPSQFDSSGKSICSPCWATKIAHASGGGHLSMEDVRAVGSN